KLLIFPAPSMVDTPNWEKLMALVTGGSTLLVTGPFDNDRYLMPAGRSSALGIVGSATAVGTEEHLMIDGKEFRIGFRGGKLQKVEKFVVDGTAAPSVVVLPAGKGTIVWSPLPVESGDSVEA